MSSEAENDDVVTNRREVLERGYWQQLAHEGAGETPEISFHLNKLRESYHFLSAVRLVLSPITINEFRLQDYFLLADISVCAIANMESLEMDCEIFDKLWHRLSFLHSLLRRKPDLEVSTLEAAIHMLHFASLGLCVLSDRSSRLLLDPEWTQVARSLIPDAASHGLLNDRFATVVASRIDNIITLVQNGEHDQPI